MSYRADFGFDNYPEMSASAETVADLSNIYRGLRGDRGASKCYPCKLFKDDVEVGRISYNGRVWPLAGADWNVVDQPAIWSPGETIASGERAMEIYLRAKAVMAITGARVPDMGLRSETEDHDAAAAYMHAVEAGDYLYALDTWP